jgi:hypothetical protein
MFSRAVGKDVTGPLKDIVWLVYHIFKLGMPKVKSVIQNGNDYALIAFGVIPCPIGVDEIEVCTFRGRPESRITGLIMLIE